MNREIFNIFKVFLVRSVQFLGGQLSGYHLNNFRVSCLFSFLIFNPLQPGVAFLYPLKTLKFSDVQGV